MKSKPQTIMKTKTFRFTLLVFLFYISTGNVSGATSYSWAGPNGFTATTQSISISTTTALQTGLYTVAAVNGTIGCGVGNPTKVNVVICKTPAPTGLESQTVESGDTIATLVVDGTAVKWYDSASDASSKTNPLSITTILLSAKIYFATQTLDGCESNTSLAVIPTVTLGVNDFESKAFSYYPNPVLDELNLSYPHGLTRVKLFNVLGQRVYTKNLSANSAKIDMSNYKEGLYFMEVESNKSTKIIKVIKK